MRRFIGPALIVLFAVLVVLGFRDDGDGPVAAPAAQAEEQPRYVLRGARWQSYDPAGAVRYEGRAANIAYFDDESARMKEFEVTLLAARGAPWTATAPEAFAPAGSRDRMQLRGGVEGQGRWPDGEALTFRTPDLWVDASTEVLETEAAVEVNSATRRAKARGLKVSGEKQRLALLHEVEMRYVPR